MEDLPVDVVRELILPLLPPHYFVMCLFVCKQWNRICSKLKNPGFVNALYEECCLPILEWFHHKLKFDVDTVIFRKSHLIRVCATQAALCGYLPFFYRMREKTYKIYPSITDLERHICRKAALGGQIELLKWLTITQKMTIDYTVALRAAKSGSVPVFMFLWNNFPTECTTISIGNTGLVCYGSGDEMAECFLVWALKSNNKTMLDALDSLQLIAPRAITTSIADRVIKRDHVHSFQWMYEKRPLIFDSRDVVATAEKYNAMQIINYITNTHRELLSKSV